VTTGRASTRRVTLRPFVRWPAASRPGLGQPEASATGSLCAIAIGTGLAVSVTEVTTLHVVALADEDVAHYGVREQAVLHHPGYRRQPLRQFAGVADRPEVAREHPFVGLAGLSVTQASPRARSVASRPKANSSRGTGAASASTSLFNETITT
jgi:hypothetical protein